MKIRTGLFAGLVGAALTTLAAPRPVALVGDMGEAMTVQSEASEPAGVRVERLGKDVWLKPGDFEKYAAVAVVGRVGALPPGSDFSESALAEAVAAYVKGGGTLVLTGEAYGRLSTNAAPAAAALFAFGSLEPWTYAKIAVGQGAVYCSTQSICAVRSRFKREKKLLGEADDKGVYHLSREGQALEDYTEALRRLLKAIPGADHNVVKSDWGIKPLGKYGTLQNKKPVIRQPVYKKRPVYAKGLKVAGPGVDKVVVLYPRAKSPSKTTSRTYEPDLAKELAWHLTEMCPAANVELRLYDPKQPDACLKADETTIVVASHEMMLAHFGIDYAKHPAGTSFLTRKGKWFLIGGEKSGRSHALTYLLEAMGCRYLWPSAAHHGKIIPRGQKELFLPEIVDWTYTPAIKLRGVRCTIGKKPRPKEVAWNARVRPDIPKLGLPAEEYYLRQWEARQDEHPGNRDFFAWHGVMDENTLEGTYKWGHAFTDYWDRYHETHPEFFALQPNGSRDQGPMLGTDSRDRCTLCLSNDGLAEEVAKNIVEFFHKNPGYHAASIALNDAGPVSECMCENCRKLDPPNAKASFPRFGPPVNGTVPYVRMTDRVMAFNNKVAAILRKTMPEKKLCFIAYGNYCGLPCAVRPDPSLAVFDVVGDYTTSSRNVGIGNLISWMQYGCESFWRPNILRGLDTIAPQNFARRLFEDMETAKANNCVGTDFDCYWDRWAGFGFVYYMMSVAFMNPDHLSYEDVANDYFEHAFGPAAPAMKRYYGILEDYFAEIADDHDNMRHPERREFYKVQRHYRFEPLEACLAEAKAVVKDKPEFLARVNFHAAGIEPAKFERRIVEAFDADDLEATQKAQQDLLNWIKEKGFEDMPANNPLNLLFHYSSPCLNWLEWRRKAHTKVRPEP